MKKFTFLKVVVLTFILLISIFNAKAQVTVDITYASNHDTVMCSIPGYGYFNMGVLTTGLLVSDSLEVAINFGDGTSETFKMPNINGNYFDYHTNHTYYTPGHFDCRYIATSPTGESDTVIVNNEVYISDTCGDISGIVYYDANGNCINDAGDVYLWDRMVRVSNGVTPDKYLYTDINGNYSVNVGTGYTYTVTLNAFYNGGFNITCPTIGYYSVSSVPQANLDFGVTCSAGFDLTGSMDGWGFRPGFQCSIDLTGYNYRCLPTDGRMRLVVDPMITFISSNPTPDNISGDTLSWNFTNLHSFNSFWRSATFMTSTSAVIGDSICATLIMEPTTGDADPANNTIYECFPIKNSWDPNMKEVQPFDKESVYQNTPLTYTIHFQNTGNDTAYKVIIIDTLDSNLDPSTIELIQSSHDIQFYITPDNVMSFTFNNIMLPDSGVDLEGSNGFVKYRINQKLNVPGGNNITNRAYIYFDFNPAVATNEVSNLVEIYVGTSEQNSSGDEIAIYPNPSDGFITIEIPANYNAESISFVDITGRIIKRIPITQTKNIDLSGLPDGIYYINIMTKDGIVSKKLIVSK
jgi:uncharacterized repeat protein (TIGR01451 family)